MKNKFISLLIFFAAQFCLFQLCVDAQEIVAKELLTTFTMGHKFGGSSITFNSDGTYKIESGDCTTEYFSEGKYVFSEGILNLKTLKIKNNRRGYDENAVKDLPEELRKKVKEDFSVNEEMTENEKEERYIPVKWAARFYLIPENEMERFCNAVNFGIEPRLEVISEPFYGAFYLRKDDEFKDASGSPSLPAKWNQLILKKPIIAKITKIENGEKNQQNVEINQGSNSGLRVGMRLIKKNQKPSLWSYIEVVAVEKYTAKLSVRSDEELKIGDVLTSKFVRSREDEIWIRVRREQMKKMNSSK